MTSPIGLEQVFFFLFLSSRLNPENRSVRLSRQVHEKEEEIHTSDRLPTRGKT